MSRKILTKITLGKITGLFILILFYRWGIVSIFSYEMSRDLLFCIGIIGILFMLEVVLQFYLVTDQTILMERKLVTKWVLILISLIKLAILGWMILNLDRLILYPYYCRIDCLIYIDFTPYRNALLFLLILHIGEFLYRIRHVLITEDKLNIDMPHLQYQNKEIQHDKSQIYEQSSIPLNVNIEITHKFCPWCGVRQNLPMGNYCDTCGNQIA